MMSTTRSRTPISAARLLGRRTTFRHERRVRLGHQGLLLECREAPAVLEFIGTNSGSWNDPANFRIQGTTTGAVPANGDSLIFDGVNCAPETRPRNGHPYG